MFSAALAVGSWFGVGEPRAMPHPSWGPPPTATEVHVSAPAVPAPAFDANALPDPDGFPHLNPAASKSVGWLQAEGPAPVEGDGQRLVTFTFDDGPSGETTPAVLELLARHHVRATFFFIGKYLEGSSRRATAARTAALAVKDAGHLIGSHTQSHALLTNLPAKKQALEIDDGIAAIEHVIGSRPTLFRPPYGGLGADGEALLRERKLDLVMWSIEVGDMKNADESAMLSGLIEQIDYAGGGTILLHDIKRSTVHVLGKLLDWLDAHAWDPAHPERVGYVVRDLPSFLRATAAHPQPFADRKALEESRAAAWRKTHPQRASTELPSMLLLDETTL